MAPVQSPLQNLQTHLHAPLLLCCTVQRLLHLTHALRARLCQEPRWQPYKKTGKGERLGTGAGALVQYACESRAQFA